MFAQQRKNKRKSAKSVSDRYLTRSERKALEWFEKRRMIEEMQRASQC